MLWWFIIYRVWQLASRVITMKFYWFIAAFFFLFLKISRVIPVEVMSCKAVGEGSSISLNFSPFVTINEIIPNKYYQSIFVAIWNFWHFYKNCKIWVWPNFRDQFKIEFLEASSPNFHWRLPETVRGSAKVISWSFGIKKNISFEILKKC